MNPTTRISTGLAAMALIAFAPGLGAEAAEFYAGKKMELAIGGSPGGGYDRYGRTLARHMPNFIPGKPSIIPRNRPGAGSRKATAWLYSNAPKDGTVFAILFPGALTDPLIRPKRSKWDARKFNFIGSINQESRLCIARKDSGIRSFKDLFKKKLLVAASQRGGSSRDFPNFMNNMLGTKFEIISGYKGSKDMILSIERGETHGLCGYAWSSFRLQRPKWAAGEVVTVLVQLAMGPNAEMTKLGAPMIWDFVKTRDQRKVMEFFFKHQVFGRPIVAPPGVPADRVAILRQAFDKATRSAGFIKDAKKVRLSVSPISGKEVARLIAELYGLPGDVMKRVKAVTKFKKKS